MEYDRQRLSMRDFIIADQRLTTLAGNAITSSVLSSRQTAKIQSTPLLLPVRSSATISELLTSPAILASEQANHGQSNDATTTITGKPQC